MPSFVMLVENFPWFWSGIGNVLIVSDAAESREQLDRDIKNIVGVVSTLLLGKESITDRLKLWRESAAR